MSLPEDFLTQLNEYGELSKREKEVFLEIFGRGKSRVQITQALNISDSNLGSCLTGIYKKFSISGSGPIKENRLREYLSKRYAQYQPSGCLTSDVSENAIDTLVEEIREQVKLSIKERCGTMRVLDMTQPIELTGERGIYTNVNILKKITGRRRLEIAELLQNCDVEDFERFGLSRVSEERVPGLEAVKRYSKLMVLGKPGAGKTTFLKYLAMQCIEGLFQANRVPLFITLKDFAETPGQPDLLTYLSLWDGHLARPKTRADKMSTPQELPIQRILQEGRALVLLDGLDEVREEDTKRVLRQILEISDQFHTNQFVITCRIAAKEYTFERFTEVEVADFDNEQIAIFAQNWFRSQENPSPTLPASGRELNFSPRFGGTKGGKAERFIQKLEQNKPIQELATNPLLLTMLCLVFGEAGNFPANRSELHKEGLDVLLKKWDAKRNIERDQVYKNLSLQRKEDLLSQIALTTFEQKDYFFKQKMVETYIADFIRNLRDASTEPKELELDSEAVLKSIEGQHGLLVERAKGIYSFSHLTFQEYFAAREIVANSALENLVEHITEKRWREVFLLTAAMMRKADDLVWLIKQKIDALLAGDENLQRFLGWVDENVRVVEVEYKPAVVRAYYFEIAFALALAPSLAHDNALADVSKEGRLILSLRGTFALVLAHTVRGDDTPKGDYKSFGEKLAVDYAIVYALVLTFALTITNVDDTALNLCLDRSLNHRLDAAIDCTENLDLNRLLLQLKVQIPCQEDNEGYKAWWKANGQAWTEQLRTLMIEHRNIGHDWQFTDTQKELLQQYYDTNKLLVDCLNSDCYISRKVRQEIEDTLLLPMAEIEKRHR
ncbi:NACHT domain-containing NTPase [Tolypothrix campylonemoides VB511288]|nr:NACHT domain-containing NTPase [Tolypothrix campylonemoides VB511288]